MSWLGRRLARRENGFLKRLADVPGVPDWVDVRDADGKTIDNLSSHVFIEGGPFRVASQANDQFFDRLIALVQTLHARDMAYVDMNKRENVIVDTEGRPWLIDFQVSFALSKKWPGNGFLARLWLKTMIEMDMYHLGKHYARCRPDLLTEAEREAWLTPPAFIRWHRKIGVPFRTLRRALLVRLNIREASGRAQSEQNPEMAFRSDAENAASAVPAKPAKSKAATAAKPKAAAQAKTRAQAPAKPTVAELAKPKAAPPAKSKASGKGATKTAASAQPKAAVPAKAKPKAAARRNRPPRQSQRQSPLPRRMQHPRPGRRR